jgi:sulfate/thiosulfate transport system permease protein
MHRLEATQTSRRRLVGDSPAVRRTLIGLAVALLTLFLLLPLVTVFAEAMRAGMGPYFAAFSDPDTLSSIRLTFLVALVSVPLNVLFGVAAAWVIAKYHFFGKSVLMTLIDLPFAVSPVVAGLLFVLLFGKNGWLGGWLEAHGMKIIFAFPGIAIATMFVTFPYVARELIPLMQSQGTDEEEAALSLGSGGLRTFWKITLPNIKWGLLYGVILCTARAIGEFGAVSVVSELIRGQTVTMPLQIEILYNEFHSVEAFAVASLMALLAIVTLVVKNIVEWKAARDLGQQFASATREPNEH